jgi:two-component system, LytTR family, response regulator
MKIRTLIVDDERLARQRLRRMLVPHSEIDVIGECADGSEAIAATLQHEPDLLLLDIQMPSGDGFQVIDALGSRTLPIVIFVTAFDAHALRAFDACALDYLLKPVSPARLDKAIIRATNHLVAIKSRRARVTEAAVPTTQRFLVRTGQRASFVAPEEIDWIEAGGNYAVLHVRTQNHLLRATMASLETQLPKHFYRSSRSAIVNLRKVKELQSSRGNHQLIMHDGHRIPVTGAIRELHERLRLL